MRVLMSPMQAGLVADSLQDEQEAEVRLFPLFQVIRKVEPTDVAIPIVLQRDQVTVIQRVLEKEWHAMADLAWDLYRKKGTNEMSLAAFTLLADWQALWNAFQRAEVTANLNEMSGGQTQGRRKE
ncbi:MAG: hypothetical protein ABF608_11330 [Sporolactobacillus sp.]